MLCDLVSVVLSALLACLSLCNILSALCGRFIWTTKRLQDCCVIPCSQLKGVQHQVLLDLYLYLYLYLYFFGSDNPMSGCVASELACMYSASASATTVRMHTVMTHINRAVTMQVNMMQVIQAAATSKFLEARRRDQQKAMTILRSDETLGYVCLYDFAFPAHVLAVS